MSKIYIGNLSPSTSEEALAALFEKFGPIVSCDLMKDRVTQASRGFAFIELDRSANMASAIRELNGSVLDGNEIQVSEARPKREGGARGGGDFRSRGPERFGNRSGGSGRYGNSRRPR